MSQLEIIVRGMEYFGSRPGTPVEECLKAVRSCRMYVGIFGMRYGSIPDGHERSMTHLEYDEAQLRQLPSLIYILDEAQPLLPKYVETGPGAEALRFLKGQLAKRHVVSRFTSPEDLARRVLHDVPEALRNIGANLDCAFPELAPAAAGPQDNSPVLVLASTTGVSLTINRDFFSFGEEDQAHILRRIRDILGDEFSGPIPVRKKEPGSVRLLVELPPEFAERLVWAVRQGRLDDLQVVTADVVDIEPLGRGEQTTEPEDYRDELSNLASRTVEESSRQPPLPTLNPRQTFESFIVGSSNRFAHAAALAVAQSPGSFQLFICGGMGLGKTHLLHAIGNAVLRSHPDARVLYVSGERFTNEMMYSIQHAQTMAFRNKYRSVDLLLIDDIQCLAGKESIQEECFYTFNALRDAHKQVVVTADKPPNDIPILENRLALQLNRDLIANVQQPDLEMRIAILRNRCAAEGDSERVPPNVLQLIADRIRNVRDLEGCLARLLVMASLVERDITVDLAEEVLHEYVDPKLGHLSPERILAVVSERFGVRTDALRGKRRTQAVALPRQVAMYLLRQLTDLSLVEIGRLLGGRDHTTVLYACDKVEVMLTKDKELAQIVSEITISLAPRGS